MPTNTWAAVAAGNWSVDANWSLTHKPAAGEDVVFDATSVVNCTLDEATAAINSLTVAAGYSGTLALGAFAMNVTGGGDMTFDGTGIVDCGSSVMTCAGNFDNQHQTTWTRDTSLLVMTGASKTLNALNTGRLRNLTISGSASITTSGGGLSLINGVLTVDAGGVLNVAVGNNLVSYAGTAAINGTVSVADTYAHAGIALGVTGSLVGTGTCSGTTVTVTNGGDWSVAQTTFYRSCTLSGGIYASTNTDFYCANVSRIITLGTGAGQTLTFTGNVKITANIALNTYTVNCATNNPDLEFQGDVICVESAGTIIWNKGTGWILFTGTANQNANFLGLSVEDIEIDKGAGTVTLLDDLNCDSLLLTAGGFDANTYAVTTVGNLTGVAGTLDFGGAVWTIGGDLTLAPAVTVVDPVGSNIAVLDGLDINGVSLAASGAWTLDVTGTAALHNLTIANCDASGGSEISATDNCVDGGGNTNVNFGAAVMRKAYILGGGIGCGV